LGDRSERGQILARCSARSWFGSQQPIRTIPVMIAVRSLFRTPEIRPYDPGSLAISRSVDDMLLVRATRDWQNQTEAATLPWSL